jgi:hypothetical protein
MNALLRTPKEALLTSILSFSLVGTTIFLSAGYATAAPVVQGITGGSLKINIASSATKSEYTGAAAKLDGVQGRVASYNAPISVPNWVLVDNKTTVVRPRTHELAIAKHTNFYEERGYSLFGGNEEDPILGNQNPPVINAGIETALSKHADVFSGTQLAPLTNDNSSADELGFQFGVGYQF